VPLERSSLRRHREHHEEEVATMTLAERCNRIMNLIDDALTAAAPPSPQVDEHDRGAAMTRPARSSTREVTS
jgi:hypothetical protein